MGKQNADRIREIYQMRGTSMHTYLEGYIKDKRHLDLTAIGPGSRAHGKRGCSIGARGPGRSVGH